MSEIPERKVLKEMLAKLKSKAINSEKFYQVFVVGIISRFENLLQDLGKAYKENPDSELGFKIIALIRSLRDNIYWMMTTFANALEDKKIYLESLESYSKELDDTLSDIFKQAEKMAEEQRKQQEEIMKRKSPESYIE